MERKWTSGASAYQLEQYCTSSSQRRRNVQSERVACFFLVDKRVEQALLETLNVRCFFEKYGVLFKFTLVVDNDTTVHDVHARAVAFQSLSPDQV